MLGRWGAGSGEEQRGRHRPLWGYPGQQALWRLLTGPLCWQLPGIVPRSLFQEAVSAVDQEPHVVPSSRGHNTGSWKRGGRQGGPGSRPQDSPVCPVRRLGPQGRTVQQGVNYPWKHRDAPWTGSGG